MGFRQILSAYYVWNYFGLEYEIFQSKHIVNDKDLDDGFNPLAWVLSQTDTDIDLFRYPEKKEMGIGCACMGDSYACLVAIADVAPVRDIKERIPTYQEPLASNEQCRDRCAWLHGSPDFHRMFATEECPSGQY